MFGWIRQLMLKALVVVLLGCATVYLPYGGFAWYGDWQGFVRPALMLLLALYVYDWMPALCVGCAHLFRRVTRLVFTRRGYRGGRAKSGVARKRARSRLGGRSAKYSGDLLSGQVRWYNHQNHYGFISPLDKREGAGEEEDVFFHRNDVERQGSSRDSLRHLRDGALVEYAAEPSTRGPKAIIVRVQNDTAKQKAPKERDDE